ncbi:MAG: hypothetical protein ACREE4_09000 [Stellaceae bacterium]
MTLLVDSDSHCERDNEEEIEITPEMIEAGVNELALFDSVDRGEWIVDAVYRAMARVAMANQKAEPAR